MFFNMWVAVLEVLELMWIRIEKREAPISIVKHLCTDALKAFLYVCLATAASIVFYIPGLGRERA
jgi:hypothetical protein